MPQFVAATPIVGHETDGSAGLLFGLPKAMLRFFLILTMTNLGVAGAVAGTALPSMNGTWNGEGRYFVFDTERMQANLLEGKPFQRDALVIRNIAGKMITFEINTQRFIGLFDGGELRLTGDGIQGSVTLRRTIRP